MTSNRGRVISRRDSRNRIRATLLGIVLFAALIFGACTRDSGSARAAGGSTPEMIKQHVVTDLPVAPEASRVDLAMPTFSNPTDITNPLFPISETDQVIMLGTVDGDSPPRSEDH